MDIAMWMNGNGKGYIPNIYPYGNGYIPSIDMLHYHEMVIFIRYGNSQHSHAGLFSHFLRSCSCVIYLDGGHEFNFPWLIIPVVPHKAVAEVSKIGNL
jgi:hypothetical protein